MYVENDQGLHSPTDFILILIVYTYIMQSSSQNKLFCLFHPTIYFHIGNQFQKNQ